MPPESVVARALVRAGQSQHTGQALLTTGAAEWLTLSPDKVTRPSLRVAGKVTNKYLPLVRAHRGAWVLYAFIPGSVVFPRYTRLQPL